MDNLAVSMAQHDDTTNCSLKVACTILTWTCQLQRQLVLGHCCWQACLHWAVVAALQLCPNMAH